jgi:hypothetical protein
MNVINLALVLIESLVQNCRRPFHLQIARGDGGKKFFESLKKVAMVRLWDRLVVCEPIDALKNTFFLREN